MNPFDKHFGPEDRLHISCCDYLDLQYPQVLYTHPANEAKRSNFERYKAVKLRMMPGVPDLLLFHPGGCYVGLAVEFKSGKNKQSPNQVKWQKDLEARGWRYVVINNLDHFIELCNIYFKPLAL